MICPITHSVCATRIARPSREFVTTSLSSDHPTYTCGRTGTDVAAQTLMKRNSYNSMDAAL